jgi:hypothetical protein
MHSQIVSGLYTTTINLSPIAYREKKKMEKTENKGRGVQAIVTTPLHHCWEGYEQLMKEPSVTGIFMLVGSGPEGFHLILRQVGVVPRPQQLQLRLSLREVRQGSSQHQPGPPMDPVDGYYINATINQFCGW